MKTIQLNSINDIAQAAHEFIAQMGDETAYAFYGEMGAGKTTIINAICKALGVESCRINFRKLCRHILNGTFNT